MNNKPNYFHKLTCVQFPGVVKDSNKALECLGGLSAISKACESSKPYIELNFRPKDPFCKPALSTLNETTGLLLKIRVKKKKTSEGNRRRIMSTEVLGVVHEIFSFQSLVDYQYLPMAPVYESDASSGLKCILNDIIPSSMTFNLDWLDEPTPYFFVPPIFSRITSPQVYSYCDTLQTEADPELKNIISKIRKTRSNFAHYINFSHTDQIPTVAKRQAIELIKDGNEYLKTLEEIFEKKPIRGRIELNCITNFPSTEMKVLLAAVAYNYVNGPWRGLWIKLGYDPRKDPQSRIWQSIDYRVKALGKLTKRGKKVNYSFTPIKDGRPNNRRSATVESGGEGGAVHLSNDERLYIFKPDILPIKTQTFYQFCYIYVPEIQDMFARLGEVLPGALCHEKRGWLPSGFHEQCRLIMSKHTLSLIKQLSGNSDQQPGTSAEVQPEENIMQTSDMMIDEVDGDNNEDEVDGENDEDDDEEYGDDNIFPESDVEQSCDFE